MIFVTSDTHFHHAAVVEYCKRPFTDVEAMNEALIANWNARVRPEDEIIHLGDFAFGPRSKLAPTLERLNGHKTLVRGNHDRSKSAMLAAGFDDVCDRLEWTDNGSRRLYFAHIPLGVSEPRPRKYDPPLVRPAPPHDFWLCGHVHEHFRRRGNVINVGVDQWNFRPITIDEALAAVEG